MSKLEAFAREWHLPVTSSLRPGDPGLHGEGRAVDVVVPPGYLQDKIKHAAAMVGIHILPEEYIGTRNGARSTGPHWHLSLPEMRNGRLVY